MPAGVRSFACPNHGEVTENTRTREFHCCEAVGHRCGWTGDPDDTDGCHRPLLALVGTESVDVTASLRRKLAEGRAPATPAPSRQSQLLLGADVSREALQPLSDVLDEAIEHVASGESAVCPECGSSTGSCPVARLQAVTFGLRVQGLLPWNSMTPRLLARVADKAIADAVGGALLERYPTAEWREGDGAWELWSGPLIAPLSGPDDAIERPAVAESA